MKSNVGYTTSRGVENGIKDAAKKAAAADASLDTGKRIRLEYFNRFLSRIFSEGHDSDWILKGGTGMLARVPSTRATQDIDLAIRGFSLEEALADLVRLAKVDLHDYFRFEYADHTESMGNDLQPYASGYRVKFDIYIGVNPKGSLQIDLAVGSAVTGNISHMHPANFLELPRLISYPYRLYPIVDQIADKVCATLAEFSRGRSSREKDLVDLVVIAKTHDIEGEALRYAIMTESRRRRIALPPTFSVPSSWGRGYSQLAKSIPHCLEYPTVELAVPLIAEFLEPILSGSVTGTSWSHESLRWL